MDDAQLSALKAIAFPLIVVDIETTSIIDVNPKAIEVYGYTHSEFTKMRLFDLNLVVPLESLNFWEPLRQKHSEVVYGLTHTTKPGSVRQTYAIISQYLYKGREIAVGILPDAPDRSDAAPSPPKETISINDLLTSVRIPFLIVSPKTQKFITANPAACMYYGYSLAEFKSLSIPDLWDSPDPAAISNNLNNVRKGLQGLLTVTHKLRGGEKRKVEIHPFAIEYAGQEALLAMIRDVTEIETFRQQVEIQYAELFANLSTPMYVIDQETIQVLDVNEAAIEFYGFSREVFLSKSLKDLSTSPPKLLAERISDTVQSKTIKFDSKHILADGLVHDVNVTATSTVWNGRPALLALVVDNSIEARVQALQMSIMALFENMPVMAGTYNKIRGENGKLIDLEVAFANKLSAGFHGFEPDEFVGKRLSTLFNETIFKEEMELFNGLQGFEPHEIVRFHPDQELYEELVFFNTQSDQIVILAHDVSEHVKLSKVLQEQQRDQQKMLDTIPVLLWSYSEREDKETLNKQWLQYTGMDQTTAEAGGWLDAIHPDDRASATTGFAEVRASGEIFTAEQRLRGADGQYNWFLTRAKPFIEENGSVNTWYGVNINITDVKQSMAALKERVKELTAIKKMNDLVQDKNQTVEQIFNYMSALVTEGFQFPEKAVVHMELGGENYNSENYSPNLTNKISTSVFINSEIRGELTVYYTDDSPFILPEEQTLIINIAHRFEDWYRQRNFEAEIKSLVYSINQANIGLVVMDRDGIVRFANIQIEELTGFSQEEVVGKRPNFFDASLNILDQLKELSSDKDLGKSVASDVQITKKDGSKLWVSRNLSPTYNSNDQIMNYVMTFENIEKRIQDQHQISQALQFNKAILEASPYGTLVYTNNLHCVSVNTAANKILDKPFDTPIRNFDIDKLVKAKGFEPIGELSRSVLKTKIPETITFEYRRKDGKLINLEFDLSPFRMAGETQMFMLIRDVTSRKKREEEVERANQELALAVSELEKANSDLSLNHRNLELLREMDELLMLCATNDEAYTVFRRYIGQLFSVGSAGLYIMDSKDHEMILQASTGKVPGKSAFASEQCWCMRRGKPHEFMMGSNGLKCAHIDPTFEGSYFAVPFSLMAGETKGMLHVEWQLKSESEQNEKLLATTLTEHLALSLSNIQLRQILDERSRRDALTGVYNRRQMLAMLNETIHTSQRENKTFCLLEFDIDHFKNYNDTFGHLAGDHVLVSTVNKINGLIRDTDTLFRVGGEEFVILMPGATLEVGRKRAENLRESIADMSYQFEGKKLGKVTISIGIACYPEHATETETLFSKMDGALYKAKNDGRDRVCAAENG